MRTAGTLTVSDNSGNTGRLVLSLGTIQPANQITDPVLQACAGDVSQLGSSFERTLAVPFAVQVQLTSTLSSDLTINLANEFVAAADGPPGPIDVILLAKGYSAGPECADPAANARVKWQNALPSVPYVWHGYILEPNAITPNDPTGATSDLHRLLLDPLVILSAGSFPTINYVTADSPSEVLCQYPMGGGSGRPLLAVDPSTVLNYGCSPA